VSWLVVIPYSLCPKLLRLGAFFYCGSLTAFRQIRKSEKYKIFARHQSDFLAANFLFLSHLALSLSTEKEALISGGLRL
jgi:hypothetical protein